MIAIIPIPITITILYELKPPIAGVEVVPISVFEEVEEPVEEEFGVVVATLTVTIVVV